MKQILYLSLIIAIAGLGAIAETQRPTRVLRVGLLRAGAPHDPYVEAFREGLRELGYVEGQNFVLEDRWAEGRSDLLPSLASELVQLTVDVIFAVSTPAALAAKRVTTAIPIVIAFVGDPVGSGLVASLARPGGNITGSSFFMPEMTEKRLELVKEAIPSVSRVAVLVNPNNPVNQPVLKEMQSTARSLGLELQQVEVRAVDDFASAFSAMIRKHADGLIVFPDPLFTEENVARLARKNRLPAIYQWKEFAEAGGLMAYGPSLADISRRAAFYVDKTLKGTKPADLPVEQPMKFELVINLKTAKQVGLTIPQSVLYRADKVIK